MMRMKRFGPDQLAKLPSELPSSLDFLIIGEMHGSKQNGPVVQECLRALLTRPQPCTVAFEWMLSGAERGALRKYIHGGKTPAQLPTFFLDSDGRFTHEHIPLLRWIRAYNYSYDDRIDIHTFDDLNGGEDADQSMADSLRTYKKQHPQSTILVETGNMHARNSSFSEGSTTYQPMAALLKTEYSIFSIFLSYQKGKINIEGRNVDVARAASQRENPERYFDAVITIPRAEPAQNPKELAEIINMDILYPAGARQVKLTEQTGGPADKRAACCLLIRACLPYHDEWRLQ
jgi:hypothetical protein